MGTLSGGAQLLGVVRKNLFLFVGVAVLLAGLIVSFGMAAQTSGSNENLGNTSFNVGFDFATSAEAGIINTSIDFVWNGTTILSGPPESLTTQRAVYTRNGWLVDGLGPNKNINSICQIFFTPTRTSFPIYAVNDGLAFHNPTTGEYAAIVITAINHNTGNITFDYRHNTDNATLASCSFTEGCQRHQNQSACESAAGSGENCHWESFINSCQDGSSGGSGGSSGAYVDCYQFDNNPNACGNISVCTKTGDLCDPDTDFNYATGIQCGNVTNTSTDTATAQSLCNTIETSPLCSWNSTTSKCATNTSKTFNDLPNPATAEGADICEDAGTNITKCNRLRDVYMMPCANISGTCKADDAAIFGGAGGQGGGFEDITSKSSCEAAGGTWNTESYQYTDNYGISQTGSFSFCEFAFGNFEKESCNDSCWACERNDTAAWSNGQSASNACGNSSLGFCTWTNDSRAPNGFGWCDPNSKTEFIGGDCSTTNCFACFGQTLCAAQSGCSWTSEPWTFPDGTQAGHCDPTDVANFFNGNLTCKANFDNTTCGSSLAGCNWNTTWQGASAPFGVCHQNLTVGELCFFPGDEDRDNAADCADSDCQSDPFCGFTGSGTPGLGAIDPSLCFQHDGNQTKCQSQNGTGNLNNTAVCIWDPLFKICDPLFTDNNGAGAGIPEILGVDTQNPAGMNSSFLHLDINATGLFDGLDSFEFGFMMNNLTNLGICSSAYSKSENKSGIYQLYLDIDKNTTNSCNVTDDQGNAQKGFEYYFDYNASVNGTNSTVETKTSYKCISSVFVPYSETFTVEREGCGFGGTLTAPDGQAASFQGVLTMSVEKTAISSPANDLRTLFRTVNFGNGINDTAGPYFYTPGSFDFQFENCDGGSSQDSDGDGLSAANDPDCSGYLRVGYVSGEFGAQCGDRFDNDNNGLTDCADNSCKYDPFFCGGSVLNVNTSDTTAPKIVWLKTTSFPDVIYVNLQTNEPANTTLQFYNTSSACNTTFQKTLLQNEHLNNDSEDDYNQWHDFIIDNASVGQAIIVNTTYFYKIKSIDPSNNTAVSACLNETTRVSTNSSHCPQCQFVFDLDFTNQGATTAPLGNLVYSLDLDNDGSYTDDINQQTGGSLINYTQGRNTTLKLENPNSTKNWSIILTDIDLVKAPPSSVGNMSGDVLYNNSDGNESFGLSAAAWQALLQYAGPATRILLTVPTNGPNLFYCTEGDVSICKNMTNATKLATDGTNSVWQIPVKTGTGFSVYKTVSTASSSSTTTTSGGGGSSGGGGAGETTATASRVFQSITPDARAVMPIDNENIAFTELKIAVSSEQENAKVTVNALSDRPADVPDISGSAYQYLDVATEKLADIADVTIQFRVPKSWVSDNNIRLASVTLYRYTTQWDALPTTLTDTDILVYSDDYTFEAVSPGFSTFAIAGEAAEAPAAEVTCGNGICESGEDAATCPADCVPAETPAEAICGNGICESGEDAASCLPDCGVVIEERPAADNTLIFVVLILIVIGGLVVAGLSRRRK